MCFHDYCFVDDIYYLLKIIFQSMPIILGTAGGVTAAIIAALVYRKNGKLKQIEIIHELYNFFLSDDEFDFYETVKNDLNFKLEENKNEKLLNKCLTFFDELEMYLSLKLIDEKTVIYFASEILNFNKNNTVNKYISDTFNKYPDFNDDIIPFSGFKPLVDIVQKYLKNKR
jgi:hypothetical protein